jgi:hypothetical protein
MKEPKTKAEPRVQIKLSMPKSLAEACDAARKRAENTAYDWNAEMVEAVEKANITFTKFLDQYEAKVQANTGLTSSPIASPTNGHQPTQTRGEYRADK